MALVLNREAFSAILFKTDKNVVLFSNQSNEKFETSTKPKVDHNVEDVEDTLQDVTIAFLLLLSCGAGIVFIFKIKKYNFTITVHGEQLHRLNTASMNFVVALEDL